MRSSNVLRNMLFAIDIRNILIDLTKFIAMTFSGLSIVYICSFDSLVSCFDGVYLLFEYTYNCNLQLKFAAYLTDFVDLI